MEEAVSEGPARSEEAPTSTTKTAAGYTNPSTAEILRTSKMAISPLPIRPAEVNA